MNTSVKKIYDIAPYPIKVAFATLNGLKLNWWRGANRKKLLDELRLRENWSREQWQVWQREQLRIRLKTAAEFVPYYKKIWKGRTGDASRIEDWPLLTKADIRLNPDLFISDKFKRRRLYQVTSSGTSGTPMNYYFDRNSLSRWYALIDCRLRMANGLTSNMSWANIGGQLVSPIARKKPPFWTWNAAMNQLYLSSYHLRPETVQSYANALYNHKIEYVYGYSSSLYTLARLCLETGVSLPQVKIAITNAEPLFDYQRSAIGAAFGCKVVQTYGGSEFAFGGCECGQGKMHLWPDAGYIEVMRFDSAVNCSAGETGRFVVTGLINDAMPLIRYEVGDAGSLKAEAESCSCGRNTPLIEGIEGRNDDMILTRDGNRVGRLDPVFKAGLRIKEAQIIQLSQDDLEVRVIPAGGYSKEDEINIRQRLVDRVGEMRIQFILVDAIPRAANGKFKAVISLLKLK